MNGIICINKPEGFTSFDVIAKMRGIARQRKIGHTGTLDPLATGVLMLLLGNATKAADMVPDKTKSYIAKFKLGITTDTQDITGKVLTETKDFNVDFEKMKSVFDSFKGEISQIPPMYSAVSVGGKRLYDLARQGIEVERKPRTVNISDINLLSFDGECGEVEISCSEGTYIRTIIYDAGEKLSCGAVMTALVRTKASVFTLDDCITLEEAQKLADRNELEGRLLKTDKIFSVYPAIYLSPSQERMFTNGIRLDADRVKNCGEGLYRVYGSEFLAIAEIVGKELIIRKTFYGK